MIPNYFMLSLLNLIDIEDLEKEESKDADIKEETLEQLIETVEKGEYKTRILEYSERPKYGLDFYLPPGLKLEFKWFRFGSPQGLAYMTMKNIELDKDLLWRPNFGFFVGVHEVGHIMKIKGFDESYNTLSSAYDFQSQKGVNYTYLPK